MKSFACASEADFLDLDQILSDGQLHVFPNRELPPGCVPGRARIGFEKHSDGYVLLVDAVIQTTTDHPDVAFWLEKGETRFLSLEDLMSFFHSLKPLFRETDRPERIPEIPSEEGCQKEGTVVPGDCRTAEPEDYRVVDREALRAIQEKRSRPQMIWPHEIAGPLKQRVFGQDEAIDALADAIVLNRMNKEANMLVALLLGPTATGKSETGRSLAEVLSRVYGQTYGFINVAASEFQEEHMVQRFLGAPPGYVGHGTSKTILEPVRSNPYHVILMDEIEKAHPKVLVALMEAMDTGLLGMADNSEPICLQHCILLFTSNIRVDERAYRAASEFERAEMCRDLFTRHCGKPEISRRIQDFLVFVPLSEEAQIRVIVKFARKALHNYDAELDRIAPGLMAEFLENQTKYGAAELGNRVSRAIGRQMLQNRELDLVRGKRLLLRGTIQDMEFAIVGGEKA